MSSSDQRTSSPDAAEVLYSCYLCDFFTTHPGNWRNHRMCHRSNKKSSKLHHRHELPYTCLKCGFSVSIKSNLDLHLRLDHHRADDSGCRCRLCSHPKPHPVPKRRRPNDEEETDDGGMLKIVKEVNDGGPEKIPDEDKGDDRVTSSQPEASDDVILTESECREKLDRLEKDIEEGFRQLDRIRDEGNSLQTRIESLKRQEEDCRNEIRSLESRKDALNKRSKDYTRSQLLAQITFKEVHCKALERLQSAFMRNGRPAEFTPEEQKAMDGHQEEIRSLEKEIQAVQKELEQVEDTLKTKRDSLTNTKDQLRRAEDEHQSNLTSKRKMEELISIQRDRIHSSLALKEELAKIILANGRQQRQDRLDMLGNYLSSSS